MQNLSVRTCLRNETLSEKNAGGLSYMAEILRGRIGRLEHGATMPNPLTATGALRGCLDDLRLSVCRPNEELQNVPVL